jgi:glycosyltransferase involved in cell wall biosynthesis
MKPKVSIVTTTFNRPEYLKDALESALVQTFPEFELLVCDDGGREETKRVCESLKDARIRHIVNRSPLGAAMNSREGVMNAKADLIAFLNDDDRWTSGFLAQCVQPFLSDPDVVLTFSDHWLIDADGRRLHKETDANSSHYRRSLLAAGYVEEPLDLLLRNAIPLAMAAIFRKSAVDWKLYTKKVEGAYDYFLSYCLLRSGGRIVYVPERLTEYRVHGGSATAQLRLRNASGGAYINRLILKDQKFFSIRKEIRAKCISFERQLTVLNLRKRGLLPAIKHFATAMYYGVSQLAE